MLVYCAAEKRCTCGQSRHASVIARERFLNAVNIRRLFPVNSVFQFFFRSLMKLLNDR